MSERREANAFFMHQESFWADDPPKACQHFSVQEEITHYVSRTQHFTRTHELVGPWETQALSFAPGLFNFLGGREREQG